MKSLMLSIGYTIFFLCQFAFSLCPKHQSVSLLKFKQTLTVDPFDSLEYFMCEFYHGKSYKPYPKTSSWNMSRDCCSWDGVICDEMTGHVIELDLGCSRLVGKIDSNSSLFQLSHLQRLDLSYNNFSGSHISPEFGRFSSLTHLDLSRANFTGQIPSEITRLSKLQSLRLSTIVKLRLTTQDFKLLLQNFTQLRELDLTYVDIYSTIPLNFSSHFTNLEMGLTGLYGIIPETIFHLPNLKTLYLGGNYELSGYLPKTKWNSSASLIELDLSFLKFSSNLPRSLGDLTSLHSLYLESCNLWGPIPESLSNLTHIESLYLDGNSLNGTIPSGVFSLPSLRRLVLSNNQFSGHLEDFKSKSLFYISLSNNQLQGHLPNSIQNLVNLKILLLSSNNFSGNVDVSLFSDLKQLGELDISYNRISLISENKVKSTLPESLVYLRLAACEVKELEFLRSAKQLEQLDLSNNMLQGSLPIPPNSTRLFFISHNNLSEEIPPSICNLMSLQILDLARNNLRGEIPQCLGNITSLEVLDMRHNNLSGNISTTFSSGSSLSSLNLHGNKLEGKVPRSLANCKELQVLDLGDNHLNDIFPMWLGTLPKLRVLSLRSNKLHGPIRTLGSENMFLELRMLDISSNAFTKNLPMGLFQHLKAMRTIDQTMNAPSDRDKYYQDTVVVVTKGLELEVVRILFLYTTIDLSNNKFEGHIPTIMGDLIALRVLNISHNGFEGHIPPSLGSLSVVESLDLSSNHLVGEIPAQFASLTSLEVFNLSYNHLEGCIPQGTQLQTFESNSYEGNDGLRGFPVSKSCGDDHVSGTNYAVSGQIDDEESDSEFVSDFWKGALMGYGSGLCIGLSIIYFMISSGKPIWLARIIVELEHKIMMGRRKKQRRQRNYRRRNNHF